MGQHLSVASMNDTPINLYDHEKLAHAALGEAAWAYFSGGAADEITLQNNTRAWQDMGLAPRVLQDLKGGHTQVQLLGRPWPTPLLVAPMAHQRWAHADGEAGMALAAAAQGCGMVLSHQTSTPLQTVAELVRGEAGRGPLWFQLYWQADHGALRALIAQIETAGYEAIVLTVDAPVQGVRDRERRLGPSLPLPEHVRAVHWLAQPPRDSSGLCAGHANAAPTWDDVARLQSWTRLPVLLKGVTHPLDAVQAVRLNLNGLIVSNHGGRTLDTQPASAQLLPHVVDAVQGDAAVLVDGGIRRGTDVFKALALGADAVLVGRPCLYGLAHAGARGAAHVLRLLRDELEMAMTLCGCRTPQDITLAHLHWPSRS
jgi:4-hydroxymandelate oxidase